MPIAPPGLLAAAPMQVRSSVAVFQMLALALLLRAASAAGGCDKKDMGAMKWHNASDLGIRGKAFPNSDTLELYQRLVRATVHWHAAQRCSAERPLLRCHLCAATCTLHAHVAAQSILLPLTPCAPSLCLSQPEAAKPNHADPNSTAAVRDAVWGLSQQPAGLFIQFETDASCIFLQYSLKSSSISWWHFPSTGVAGMDLYSWDDGNATWRWTGTSHPCGTAKCGFPLQTSKMASLTCAGACKPRVYRLHLPTYAAITDDVLIGTNRQSSLMKSDSSHLGKDKPIVWYGTSILQGGVASRPGQVNTHIVSRALETEIFNFGFSGNGVMELNVAQYLTTIDASMIIIDCAPNMDDATITARTIPLVKYLRARGHATTPIVISEGTQYGTDWTDGPTVGNAPKNLALAAAYARLVAAGDKFLHYARTAEITASTLGLGRVNGALVDPTVGGTHLTDLGMRKQAAFWATAIPKFKRANAAAAVAVAAAAAAGPAVLDRPAVAAVAAAAAAAAPLSVEEMARERLASEALIATAAFEQWQGWGGIDQCMPVAAAATPALVAAGAPIDAVQFVRGRPLLGAPRNHSYDRFPLSYAPTCPCHGGDPCGCGLRNDVWALSEMSTGTYLRFSSDSPHIQFDWTLRPVCSEKWFAGCHLWHMPDSGTNAFDTYIWDPAGTSWRHYPNALLHYAEKGETTLFQPDAQRGANTTWLIYLPLRNAPETITLTPLATAAAAAAAAAAGTATQQAATVCAAGCAADAAPQFAMPPILWYGTSIQQGGVASRAGTTYDAVISRTLQREVLNLGFANNGVMELSVGQLLCDIKPASLIIIDCLPNMNTLQVTNRTGPLVRLLRSAACHGDATPIVLAEGTPTPADWLNSSVNSEWANPKNLALRVEFDKLTAAGVKHLHYVGANELFNFALKDGPGTEGADVNPTVGGIHSSDLGQYEIAEWYARYLPPIISGRGKRHQ